MKFVPLKICAIEGNQMLMQRSVFTILKQVLIFSLIFLGSEVHAHSIKQIVMDVTIEEEQWSCSFLMDATYALPEYRGDKTPAKSREWLIQQSPKDLERVQSETKKYIAENFHLTVDGKASSYAFRFPGLETLPHYFPIEPDGLAYIPVMLEGKYPSKKGKVNVEWLAESGPGLLLRLLRNGEHGGLLFVGFEDKISLATLRGEGAIVSAERAAHSIWAIDGFTALLPNGWPILLVAASLTVLVFICLKRSALLYFIYLAAAFVLTVILVASETIAAQLLFAKILLLVCSCLSAYFVLLKKTWQVALVPLFLSVGASSGMFAVQNYLDYYQNASELLPMEINHALSFSVGGLIALLAISVVALLSLVWCKSFVAQKDSFRTILFRLTSGLIVFSAIGICFVDLFKNN